MQQPHGTPPPEIEITSNLVRQLLQEQHPDMVHLPLKHLDAGWDNMLFRLGAKYIVRIPRRKIAAELLKREQDWLPILAKRLPIDVPTPVRKGKPSDLYPWHWSIIPFFGGQTADLQPLNDNQAIVMANFLKNLHQPAPIEAPTSTVRGIPLGYKAPSLEPRMARLKKITNTITPKIEAIWNRALDASTQFESRWLHGDLHPRNVIVHKGKFRAIIDWGDLNAGDVATDLACLWMLFDNSNARQKAIKMYEATDRVWARAKGWAVYFGVTLLDTGLIDNPQHAQIGGRILKNLENNA